MGKLFGNSEVVFIEKTVYVHTNDNVVIGCPGDRIGEGENHFYIYYGEKITGVFDKNIVKYIISDGV